MQVIILSIDIHNFFNFFKLKYHAFLGVFMTGHYIPQLAELMVQFNKKHKLFNLKGIAVSVTRLTLVIAVFCSIL